MSSPHDQDLNENQLSEFVSVKISKRRGEEKDKRISMISSLKKKLPQLQDTSFEEYKEFLTPKQLFEIEKIYASELVDFDGFRVESLVEAMLRVLQLDFDFLERERFKEFINVHYNDIDFDGDGIVSFAEFSALYVYLMKDLHLGDISFFGATRKFKLILSLDGGGVRGIAAAQFLVRLEEAMGGARVCDVFDMFAGVSTGSLIAAMYALGDVSATEVFETYSKDRLKRIMPKSITDSVLGLMQSESKYTGTQKTEVVNEIFGDKTLGDCKKGYMAIAYDITFRETKSFSNTHENDVHIKIADVVDASSAAPIYYPPKMIDDHWYIDGGAVMNNPAMNAVVGAMRVWGRDTEIRVVSIGTGIGSNPLSGNPNGNNRWGIVKWMKNGLLDLIGDPTPAAEQASLLLGDAFIRVTGHVEDAGADLTIDDYSKENLAALKRMGDLWWEEKGQQVFNLLVNSTI
eukprot:TRINITY_DN3382_c0_g1_i1.p1 TRINITY_DN3382_c0_g1~~TRINITY_DN3382_c0_g1_i1.p1  ORF type:complete len:460 (+),score=115.55 TRINITY_DN3382_c0_g1_i1:12-1391(+)